jgi:hypothetical protein
LSMASTDAFLRLTLLLYCSTCQEMQHQQHRTIQLLSLDLEQLQIITNVDVNWNELLQNLAYNFSTVQATRPNKIHSTTSILHWPCSQRRHVNNTMVMFTCCWKQEMLA